MPDPTPEERAEALRLAHYWDEVTSPTIAAQQQAAMTVSVDAIQKLARAFLAAESERAELAEKLRITENDYEAMFDQASELALEVERLTGLLREANYDATDSDGMLPRNPLL